MPAIATPNADANASSGSVQRLRQARRNNTTMIPALVMRNNAVPAGLKPWLNK